MRPPWPTRRCRYKRATLLRRRCEPRRNVDLPSDDDDEDIVEIGGGPVDDKPATG